MLKGWTRGSTVSNVRLITLFSIMVLNFVYFDSIRSNSLKTFEKNYFYLVVESI